MEKQSNLSKNIFFSKKNFVLFLLCLAIFSLIYSRFLLTLSMILLLLTSWIDFSWSNTFYFSISTYFRNNWKNIFHQKAFLMVTLFFFSILISGLWSEDTVYFGDRIRIRLPFLVLPLAFAWLQPIDKKTYHQSLYFLIGLMTLTMKGVLINYVLNFQAINETLLHGKNIPVPMNHIRFSLLLGFTTIVGAIFWLENNFSKKIYRHLLLAIVLFLFIGIHILTVRSGIICLYAAVVILGLRYIFLSKKYYLIAFLLVFLAGIPSMAYFLMPSVKNKITYALRDLQQIKEGHGMDYSDAERLGSIMAGLKVGNENPWLGCGYGDLDKEVNTAYRTVFPQEHEPKIPHNQYVMTYAGIGSIGLLVFLAAYFFPIFYKKNYQSEFFLALNIIIGTSFFAEATIETQQGAALYSLFLCVGLSVNDFIRSKQTFDF